MNRNLAWVLLLTLSLAALAHGQTSAGIWPVVNCDAGQSLNSAISKLNKHVPNTVMVQGTCTEYVQITGFDNLTVKGFPVATIVQPSTIPTKLFLTLLRIDASRSVLIEGLNFSSDASKPPAIGIGAGSRDVRLRKLSIVGGSAGIFVFENSQVSIAGITVQNAGWASLGISDASDVHAEDCVFEDLTGTSWHSGVSAGASHLTMRRTIIRNMQVGINLAASSIVDLGDFNTYYPAGGVSDVVIESPNGMNNNGVVIDSGSSLNVTTAKLRIVNAGQNWSGSSGGILVSGGSQLYASANLIISGSRGQGIYLTNNSHATLDGSSITGSQHGGVVAVNLSTVSTVFWDLPVTVSGNAVDLFCDAQSVISGAAKIVNATTVQCTNLLSGDSVPIP